MPEVLPPARGRPGGPSPSPSPEPEPEPGGAPGALGSGTLEHWALGRRGDAAGTQESTI